MSELSTPRSGSEAPPQRDPEGFRPDLEGLRAVAVLLVLFYHARVPGFAGGFLGVDVFFVLSGFLITGLIVRELHRTGTLSFAAFYARRARRLLPAAGVTLLATLGAAVLLLAPPLIPGIAEDIGSAALYVANFRFALLANDYFQISAAPSPVMHFWSLGVEEQFYLVWPAVLFFLFRLGRPGRDPMRRLLLGIGGISVLSFAASLWLTGVNQAWAFYGLPTRAWQLGVGGLIATAASRLSLPGRLGRVAAGTGVVLIVASSLLFDRYTPFPGMAALLPTAGAALVILSGLSNRSTLTTTALSAPPMRFLGRISYSVYLWHWPILVLGAAILGSPLPLPVSFSLALASLPIAAASQRWIEEPLRHGRGIGTRPTWNLAQAAGVSVVIVAGCLGVTLLKPSAGGHVSAPSRPRANAKSAPAPSPAPPPRWLVAKLPTSKRTATDPEPAPPPSEDASRPPAATPSPVPVSGLVLSLEEAQTGQYFADMICPKPQAEGSCVYGDETARKVVVLFGDSHAAQWLAALRVIAEAQHWRLINMTWGRCPSASVTVWLMSGTRAFTECDENREAEFARIEATHPDLVLVANYARYRLLVGDKFVDKDAPGHAEAWEVALSATVTRLQGVSRSVALLGDTPFRYDFDPVTCISQHADSYQQACVLPIEAVPREEHQIAMKVAARTGATFIDPTPWVCPQDACPVVMGKYFMWFAGFHLTPPFSAALANNLQAELMPLLTEERGSASGD